MPGEQGFRSDNGSHLGQPEAGILKLRDGPAEGRATLHVAQGLLQRPLHGRQRLHRDDEALVGQVAHELREAPARLAAALP